MFAKIILVAALAAVATASVPIITSSLSMPQRIAALQGTISHDECVPCAEAMGHAIHTAAEAGWMGAWMDKICPYLQQKYGWSEELCAVAAFLIMSDVGDHLQPDAVYNCEKIGICPKLPPGSASILSANVTETLIGLVKVNVKVNVSKPTAAGAVELRMICPPLVGSGMDVLLPKYNAGLPAGVSDINFEFSATSDMFGCDLTEGGCPGTYGMKLSVCELECEDTKHQGHAVLDVDDSLTFIIPDNE